MPRQAGLVHWKQTNPPYRKEEHYAQYPLQHRLDSPPKALALLGTPARPPKQVNLPDDFVLEKPRTPTAPGEAAVGFIPDGLATYEKTFDAPQGVGGEACVPLL